MEHVNASEMIAEIKQRQSEIIRDDQPTSEDSYDLSLDPITEDEITSELISFPALPELLESVSNFTFSKFNDNGVQEIFDAKANGKLVEFAATLPAPKECSKLLSEESRVNNTDTWTKYVYRTAYDIAENKRL